MLLEAISAIYATLVFFIMPGYAMLRAVFPRKNTFSANYDIIYRFTLGVVISIIMALVIAFGLGTIGHDGGPVSYKAPVFGTIHFLLIIGFFIAGWYRGAYPWMALIHPSLFRVMPPTVVSSSLSRNKELMREVEQLSTRRHQLQHEIEACSKRALMYDREMAEHYTKQREHLKAELEKVLARLEELDIERKQIRMV